MLFRSEALPVFVDLVNFAEYPIIQQLDFLKDTIITVQEMYNATLTLSEVRFEESRKNKDAADAAAKAN